MAAFTAARLIVAAALFVALGRLTYSYYTLLRFGCCLVAGYGAYVASERQQERWMWTFGGMALLFNPFLPVRLDRATWAVLDVAAGVVLLMSLRNTTLTSSINHNSEASQPVSPAAPIHGVASPEETDLLARRERERMTIEAENPRRKIWQERERER